MWFCCCGCPSTTWTFTVRSPCGNRVQSGVLVTITQGATTIGTCTTDGTGTCSVSIPANGSYTATASLTGYGNGTAGFTVSACASGSSTITLGYPSGYSCVTELNPCLDYPLASRSSATITDPIYGAITWSPGTTGLGSHAYFGYLTLTDTLLCAPCSDPMDPGQLPHDVTIYYQWYSDTDPGLFGGDAPGGCGIYAFAYSNGDNTDPDAFIPCPYPFYSPARGVYIYGYWPLNTYTGSPLSLTFGGGVGAIWNDTAHTAMAPLLWCASITGTSLTFTW